MNHLKSRLALLLVVFLMLSVAACTVPNIVPPTPEAAQPPTTSQPTPMPAQPAPALEGSNWILLTYQNSAGNLIDVLSDTIVTLGFSEDKVQGHAGCNTYFGAYTLDGNKLSLGPLASTRKFCAQSGVMDQETAVLAALANVAQVQQHGDTLLMQDNSGATILTWQPAPEQPAGNAGLANPASVYCEEQGGTLDIRNEAGGQTGYCVFPDGSECEEWAYYRGECAPASAQALTPAMLKNAVYHSDFVSAGEVQLVDGVFSEPIMEGSATKITIQLADMTFGDLNNDGVEDAAVILVSDPGGSGTFYELAAVLNQNGHPRHITSFALGDRVQVQQFNIRDGEIVVQMLTQGQDDPMCCPTQLVRNHYRLQEDTLIISVTEKETPFPKDSEKILPLEVLNTVWHWQSWQESEAASLSLVAQPENYTLTFHNDGTVAIQADCNRAAGSYTLEGGVLRISLGPATLAYCGDESLDQTFLQLLSQVEDFEMQDEHLLLHLAGSAGVLTLGR